MIIRSGLIRNCDNVDFNAFTAHWHDVHGPLVKKIDGLRAYRQNHILERITPSDDKLPHRVDGISQLHFDDVHGMNVAMASPEQEACIADLKGFISDVTLLIQEQGDLGKIGNDGLSYPIKLMFLLKGEAALFNVLMDDVRETVEANGQSGQIRLNPVIVRNVTVDESISAGSQIVDAVLEVWLGDASPVVNLLRNTHAETVVAGFLIREITIVDGP